MILFKNKAKTPLKSALEDNISRALKKIDSEPDQAKFVLRQVRKDIQRSASNGRLILTSKASAGIKNKSKLRHVNQVAREKLPPRGVIVRFDEAELITEKEFTELNRKFINLSKSEKQLVALKALVIAIATSISVAITTYFSLGLFF